MDFFKVVKERVSVREYSAKPVSRENLEQIVDCGRLAPTARGEEPWEFVVVTEKKKIKELGEITDHGKFLADSQAAIIVLCRDTKYFLEDGAAATENMLLGAAALSLGSCWVAGDKKAYAEDILKAVKAPRGYRLVSLIALGYPRGVTAPHKKRDLAAVLRWEGFQEKT